MPGIVAKVEAAIARNVARGIGPGHRHWVKTPRRSTLPLWLDALAVFAIFPRMTVRQLFYQLVNRGYPKTEKFHGIVDDATIQMRLAGVLGYHQFLDGSRQRRQILQYSSLEEAFERTRLNYRRDRWANQGRRVEAWCEKDAFSGLFLPICQEYGVPFVAIRGFSSMTLVYETAMEARASGKPTVVYYFGDHDPSGRNMGDNLQDDFRLHEADVDVVRVALNPDQIARYGLPTRPSKETDSRHKGFVAEYGEGSVELDALPPNVLTAMIEGVLAGEVDREEWDAITREEEGDKALLAAIEARLPGWLRDD